MTPISRYLHFAGASFALSAPLLPAQRNGVERLAVVPCIAADSACIPPAPTREFRGVWVAAVANIDWPSAPGLSPDSQRGELLALLDRSKAIGLNAVILHVRTEADALYRSKLEPWSAYLTGEQGRAPTPRYDPLAFAVREAHRRGLELHAWFNPYRARHALARGEIARAHVARMAPSLVQTYGSYLWMDPGELEVRRRTVRVIADVVRRYDVDGVHIDDYFYPYPEGNADFPDERSWSRYQHGGGTRARDDWRRQNVDLLVQDIGQQVHRIKPWVRFGVSPFGIWRPGFPAQIKGFDAYARLYADSRRWLREGWADYFTPQLYWPIARVDQAYAPLLRWWAGENVKQRHLWPGNAAHRVAEGRSTAVGAAEIIAEIDTTRAVIANPGNILYSMKVLLDDRDSLGTRLVRGPYALPALPPSFPWLGVRAPARPRVRLEHAAADSFTFAVKPAGKERPRWWMVQVQSLGLWSIQLRDADDRHIAVGAMRAGDRLVITPVSRTGILGARAAVVVTRDAP